MSNYKKRVRTCLNCKHLRKKGNMKWCGVRLPIWATTGFDGCVRSEPDLINPFMGDACCAWGKRLTAAKTGRGK